jgi:hypothetical protein
MTVGIAELLQAGVEELLQNGFPSSVIFVFQDLNPILEAVENFLDFECFASYVIVGVLWTHKFHETWLAIGGRIVISFSDNAPTYQNFNLRPISARVKFQEVDDVLAKKVLGAEIAKSLVLVIIKFEDHAEEEVRADVPAIGL